MPLGSSQNSLSIYVCVVSSSTSTMGTRTKAGSRAHNSGLTLPIKTVSVESVLHTMSQQGMPLSMHEAVPISVGSTGKTGTVPNGMKISDECL